jgi:XRE family transcriptional regulator, regulator of sulfur utilization
LGEATHGEMEMIAARIKRWREEARLTLQQLADRAGVSPSTIHKLENNQTVPTVTVFLKIAEGLGRSPGELLASETAAGDVIFTRRDERFTIDDLDGTRLEKLANDLVNPELEMWRTVIQPGVGSDVAILQEEGELILVCEEGELTIGIGGKDYLLRRGDSIHTKASVRHTWRNAGDGPVTTTLALCRPRGGRPRFEERAHRVLGRRDRGEPADLKSASPVDDGSAD